MSNQNIFEIFVFVVRFPSRLNLTNEIWKIISDINNPKTSQTITLIENGVEITSEKEVADTQNNYFLNKINDLKNGIDPNRIEDPLAQLKKKMAKQNVPKFELKPVTVKNVKKVMGKMKKKKSAGHDEISQECLLLGKSVKISFSQTPKCT